MQIDICISKCVLCMFLPYYVYYICIYQHIYIYIPRDFSRPYIHWRFNDSLEVPFSELKLIPHLNLRFNGKIMDIKEMGTKWSDFGRNGMFLRFFL